MVFATQGFNEVGVKPRETQTITQEIQNLTKARKVNDNYVVVSADGEMIEEDHPVAEKISKPVNLVAADSNAAEQINVLLDDRFITYDDDYGFPFADENNRTLVPLRLTMEAFGAEVEWNPIENNALVIKDNITVTVPIGESFVYVNNTRVDNDTEAIALENRIYIPIRIVIEAFGAEVLWDEVNFRVVINSSPVENVLATLPRSFDLRSLEKVTDVKNQGPLGTCWAFATMAALESRLLPDEEWNFSENHISMQHGYNADQNQGGEFRMALSYLTRWAGPVREEDDQYGDGVSPANLKAVKHLQEAIILPSKNYEEIKKAIYLYGAVQSAVYSPIQDYNYNSNYYNEATNALYLYENKRSNHDVVLIGWDDDFSKENFLVQPKGDGAFIAKNSWGTEFGEEGYYYISYHDLNVGIDNIVYTRIDDPDNYNNIYQTDKLGWVGNLGYDQETAYFSNVYTTKERENLKAVSFYATGDNTTYEIYVVENFKNTSSFNERKLLTKGKIKFSGYYTIDFNENIVMEKGQTFAVVVKITTPGESYPVAIEYKADEYTANVIIEDGEGYISYNGDYWQSTEKTQNSNVILKAFTDYIN
jgi:C1A family cysteine protease